MQVTHKWRDFQNMLCLTIVQNATTPTWAKSEPMGSCRHSQALKYLLVSICQDTCSGKKSLLERRVQRVRCNLLFGLPVNILIFCILYQFCFNYICDADLERKMSTSAQKLFYFQYSSYFASFYWVLLPPVTPPWFPPIFHPDTHTNDCNILSRNRLLATVLFS